jgi:hypothetical protein
VYCHAEHRIGTEAWKRTLITDHAVITFTRVALNPTSEVGDGMRIAGQMPTWSQLRLVAVWQPVREMVNVAIGVALLSGRDWNMHEDRLSYDGQMSRNGQAAQARGSGRAG